MYLDGGNADLNKMTGYRQAQKEQQLGVQVKPEGLEDDGKYKYCGRIGHGAIPSLDKKREVCPAFDKKSCGGIGHFSKTKACKKKSVKVEKVVAQYKKTAGRPEVGVKTVGSVLDNKGRPGMLSVTKPVPHMLEVEGRRVVAMPRAHPGIRVQVEVNKAMYEKTGLPLRMGKSSMTKKGKLLQIPKVELLCDTGAQVDCINRGKLSSLGLVESQLLSPEVALGCADESTAEVLGVFFGKVLSVGGLGRCSCRSCSMCCVVVETFSVDILVRNLASSVRSSPRLAITCLMGRRRWK